MFSNSPAFKDRRDAGRRLAEAIGRDAPASALILALPRGGVPVADEIARALDAELDLLFVRKLGAPGYEELGIGAIVDGADPQIVLNEEIIRDLAPSRDYIRAEIARQLEEIERRRKEYLGDRKPVEVAGREVILVDDGVATGGTVRAALKGLRLARAKSIVLAVPVGPAEVVESLRQDCDRVICLISPRPFYAVGVHYADFRQTSDEEVRAIMAETAGRAKQKIQ